VPTRRRTRQPMGSFYTDSAVSAYSCLGVSKTSYKHKYLVSRSGLRMSEV
jgi:hypothetical protein